MKVIKSLALIFLLLAVSKPLSAEVSALDADRTKNLLSLKRTIDYLDNEIQARKNKILDPSNNYQLAKLQAEIVSLTSRLEQSRALFLTQSTSVTVETTEAVSKAPNRNLIKEVQALLEPVVDGIRRVSERPRKIEGLRSEIENISTNLDKMNQAKAKLSTIKSENNLVQEELNRSAVKVEKTRQELMVMLDTKKRVLAQELGSEQSTFDATTNVLKSFFKNKGKNILLALLSFICIWWLLTKLRSRVFRSALFSGPMQWLKKPLLALYSIIAFLIASLALVLCLYFLNDWMLVTFVVLTFTAIAWSLKQFVPQIVVEARLILNLGTVKEGERIIWNGLPWKIKRLGLQSKFVNECLEGGEIRIGSRELLNMQSRPIVDEEPWFPCLSGDWVKLEDGTWGKVKIQTPEQVILELKGGTPKTYATIDFLDLKPQNYSHGFWLCFEFGLDYELQPEILEGTLNQFRSGFQERMATRSEGKNAAILDISVEFARADSSSLNLWVRAHCAGSAASDREQLEREFQAAFVSICNEHQLSIPFQQIVVHSPKSA